MIVPLNFPLPHIETRTSHLERYQTICFPSPPRPPTKREIRDARRCLKSGMVPGAIRKYLLQKKNNGLDEEEEERGRDYREDSSSEDEHNRQERERPPSPHPHNNVASGSGEQSEGEEEELTVQEGSSSANVQSTSVSNGENNQLDSVSEESSPEEAIQRTPANQRRDKRKRSLNEPLSPDTTTPQLTSPVSSSGSSQDNPPSHSGTGLEEDYITPKKKMRKRRDSVEEPRVGPSRKSKLIAEATINNNNNNKPQLWVRSIFPHETETCRFVQDLTDPVLETQIQKNEWKRVLDRFERNLSNHEKIPSPQHLGELLRVTILGMGGRVAKDIPERALNFLSTLQAKYVVGVSQEITEYYASAFASAAVDSQNTTVFLKSILDSILVEARSSLKTEEKKVFRLFKILTKLVIQQYKDYEAHYRKRDKVKLRRPFFYEFLEDSLLITYNHNCRQLVRHLFLLKNYNDEFLYLMRWIGILSHHFAVQPQLDLEFQILVEDFVDTLLKPEYVSYRCTIIEKIREPKFGEAVCFSVLKSKIQFECLSDRTKIPASADIHAYFTAIGRSELLTGVPGIKRKEHTDNTPLELSFPQKSQKLEKVNRRGESHLHKLCGKMNASNKDLGLKLEKALRQKIYPVNPADNCGNTPLHDAVAHGRFDAVLKFHDHCSKLSLPEGLRVNLLAQNESGETPLHLAAVSDQSEKMADVLCKIANNLQVKDEALRTLNNQGKMPFELASNPAARKRLKPQTMAEWFWESSNVSVFPSSRQLLQSMEMKKILVCWKQFCGGDDN